MITLDEKAFEIFKIIAKDPSVYKKSMQKYYSDRIVSHAMALTAYDLAEGFEDIQEERNPNEGEE